MLIKEEKEICKDDSTSEVVKSEKIHYFRLLQHIISKLIIKLWYNIFVVLAVSIFCHYSKYIFDFRNFYFEKQKKKNQPIKLAKEFS